MSGQAAHRISRIALLLTTISLLCQLVLPILHIPLGAGAAPIKKINIFADGAQSKDITLSDMGTDSTTAKLSIQTGVTLANTSMLVDGRASGLVAWQAERLLEARKGARGKGAGAELQLVERLEAENPL